MNMNKADNLVETNDRNDTNIELSNSLLQHQQQSTASKNVPASSKRNLIVDILIVFFSMGSWIGIKATFLQVPLLVEVAPEGWKLPSYFVAIIQIGNLGPVIYGALQKLKPFRDANMIYFVISVGTVATVAMAIWYKATAIVFGENHSIAMFIVFFFFSIVSCTSSVLFMPYMGRFREIYLVTYIFGVDLSGLFTSLIVMVQGVGGEPECILQNSTAGEPTYEAYIPPPRFGVSALFYFVAVLMVLSIAAFALLDRMKLCRKEHSAVTIHHGNNYSYQKAAIEDDGTENVPQKEEPTKILATYNFYYLLILQGFLCLFGNAILPSIQSYSALPYGSTAFHLVVTLSTIASPVACFLAFFLPHHSIRQVTYLTVITSILGVYATVTALMSPIPPLVDSNVGVALIVTCWTLLIGINSYIRLSITSIIRFQGGKSLVLLGSIGQANSFVGAVLSFVLVNMTSLFKSIDRQACSINNIKN